MDPLAYNFTYMGPEIVFTAIGSVILLKAPHTSKLFRVYGKKQKRRKTPERSASGGQLSGGVFVNDFFADIRWDIGYFKNSKSERKIVMKKFTYTITDPSGIHARPAGMLAKKAKEFRSAITVEKSGKSVSATKLIMLMGLGIKCGDTVLVTAEGADEDAASAAMEQFFKENL